MKNPSTPIPDSHGRTERSLFLSLFPSHPLECRLFIIIPLSLSLVVAGQLQELSLPVLCAARLRVPLLLVVPLRSANGGSASYGFGAEVRAVALLCGAVDHRLVEFTRGSRGRERRGVVELGGLVLLGRLGGYGNGVAVSLDADGLRIEFSSAQCMRVPVVCTRVG